MEGVLQRGAWQQQALSCTASRATQGQAGWMQTAVPAQLGVAGLEFYLADGYLVSRAVGIAGHVWSARLAHCTLQFWPTDYSRLCLA